MIFADLSTMQGLFPPSSRVTGVRCSLAWRIPLSHSLAAGEKDVVEVLLKKAGVLLAPAHNNGNIFFRKTFADDFADDIAGGRRVGAGF